MKYLIGIFFLLFANLCYGVQVIGEGRTVEEAKQNAFATAIQTHIGSLVLSEREANNYQLIKNEIFVYSAGYIKSFKILQLFNTNNGYRIVIDVEVESSKIKDRIIGKSKDKNIFEGEKHHTQITTLLEEKSKGDKLFQNILSGYPLQAFNIISHPQSVSIDGDRNIYINVPYTLTWNSNFVRALSETLNVLEDGSNRFFSNNNLTITIVSKDIGNYLTGQNHYNFKDTVRFNMLKQTINNNRFKFRIRVTTKFKDFIGGFCGTPRFYQGLGSFYSIGDTQVTRIYGNHVETGTLQIKLDYESDLYTRFKDFNNIQLEIVNEKDCQDK